MPESPLFDAAALARAEALGLKARAIVEGLRVGEHRSPYHGFAVEFAQHRAYAPGDDYRHIDWKVFGRSDRLIIKQHEQETNFVGRVLLDASNSMGYGEGDQNKLEYARLLAATLATLIIGQRDSVGLGVFDAAWRMTLPPSSQPAHLMALLHALAALQPANATRAGLLLHEQAEQLPRPGLVFLLSDLLDGCEDVPAGLKHLRYLGHEVVVFHVLHADELDLPFDGLVRFDGLEDGERLQTDPAHVRAAYRAAAEAFTRELQRSCEESRCDYVLLNTSRPLADALGEYLAKRRRVRRV
jgi:uncharacterized protein (DUF58 family)